MMPNLSISKIQLAELPMVKYEGKIVVVNNMMTLEKVCRVLKREPLLGLDTETRPNFKAGKQYKVSLIQISTPELTFLIRVNLVGMPKCLTDILEDGSILKIGLSLKDDIRGLGELVKFTPRGFFELQTFVKQYGILDNALARIYAIIFHARISKAQRLSNWEASELSEAQRRYAATDSWSCLEIYNELTAGRFDPTKSEYVIPEEADTLDGNAPQAKA